jgi:glutamate synthase (NADPH/NADH) large chain
MAHRGGVAADGLSGDGCGVLMHGAEGFVRVLAAESGFTLHDGAVAAGMVFLPRHDAAAARCRDTLAAELAKVGARVRGWRVVPIDPAACGKLAQSSMPAIHRWNRVKCYSKNFLMK